MFGNFYAFCYKNLLIILGIFLIFVAMLSFFYYNYQRTLILANKANSEYEIFTKDEITGSALMTLINKVSDKNEKEQIVKDEKNRYIENDENSIKIEIKFLESDNIFEMEAISNLGSEAFIKNYNSMKFKCTKLEYHEKTKKIKYMLFEQI